MFSENMCLQNSRFGAPGSLDNSRSIVAFHTYYYILSYIYIYTGQNNRLGLVVVATHLTEHSHQIWCKDTQFFAAHYFTLKSTSIKTKITRFPPLLGQVVKTKPNNSVVRLLGVLIDSLKRKFGRFDRSTDLDILLRKST